MIYQTIPVKYLVSSVHMLFIEMFTGLKVMEKWREHLLEELETAENDESAVMLGKSINHATNFLKDGTNSSDSIQDCLKEKDPDFGLKIIRMMVKYDTHKIKMDEWYDYINNCLDKSTDKDFIDVFLEKYNKVAIQLFQQLDNGYLTYDYRLSDGTLNTY